MLIFWIFRVVFWTENDVHFLQSREAIKRWPAFQLLFWLYSWLRINFIAEQILQHTKIHHIFSTFLILYFDASKVSQKGLVVSEQTFVFVLIWQSFVHLKSRSPSSFSKLFKGKAIFKYKHAIIITHSH